VHGRSRHTRRLADCRLQRAGAGLDLGLHACSALYPVIFRVSGDGITSYYVRNSVLQVYKSFLAYHLCFILLSEWTSVVSKVPSFKLNNNNNFPVKI